MLFSWLPASLPILLLVGLMIGLRWGAARAGPAGWIAAALVGWIAFGAGPNVLAVAQAKAFFQSLDVLLIVTSAYLLYRVVDEAGGVAALAVALPKVTPDRGLQALLIAWAYASFLQGVGGFGVPVVVTAPILASLGFLMSARWAFWLGILVTMPAMLGAKWLFFEYPGIWLVHPAALDVTLILYCILRLTGGLGPKPGRQGGA